MPSGRDTYNAEFGRKLSPPDDWLVRGYAPQSSVLGFVTDTPCPPSYDKRYIALTNVTDGMLKGFDALWLKGFDALWHRISTSPEAFDAAISKLPVGAINASSFRFDVLQRHAAVWSISCFENNSGNTGCSAGIGYHLLDFDVGGRGIELTRLTPLAVP
jgi:hypothetical protein